MRHREALRRSAEGVFKVRNNNAGTARAARGTARCRNGNRRGDLRHTRAVQEVRAEVAVVAARVVLGDLNALEKRAVQNLILFHESRAALRTFGVGMRFLAITRTGIACGDRERSVLRERSLRILSRCVHDVGDICRDDRAV